jgi:hypothetical protein
VRGTRIAFAMLIACASWAQAPNGGGTAGDSPPKKSHIQEKAHGPEYPTRDSPFPITVVQSQDDADRATEREHAAYEQFNQNLEVQGLIAKASEKQASAALTAAMIVGLETAITLVALILVYLTFRQTRRTADAAHISAGLAKEAIDATRRPRLLIREMFLAGIDKHNVLTITCLISNAGDADGTITSSFADIQSVKPDGWKPQGAEQEGNELKGKILSAGQQISWVFWAKLTDATLVSIQHARDVANAGFSGTVQSPGIGIYVRGVIEYEDSFRVKRRTAVLRHLDAGTGRFSVDAGTDDFEYAD